MISPIIRFQRRWRIHFQTSMNAAAKILATMALLVQIPKAAILARVARVTPVLPVTRVSRAQTGVKETSIITNIQLKCFPEGRYKITEKEY